MSEQPHNLMSCREMLSSLGAYLDGEVSEELCSIIEEHMKGCPHCTIVVNTLHKTIDLYHEAALETEIPQEVTRRLYQRLHLEDFQQKESSST